MASTALLPRSWPIIVAVPERRMAMWSPASVDGAIELTWSVQGYEIGFERRVTFHHAGNIVRVRSAGGPSPSGVATAHSTLQAWGHDDSRYSLDEHESLLWLVDEEVIASIDLPTRSSTTTSMSVKGEGLRRRSDSPERLGVHFVEQLKSAWDRDGSAPVSVVSLDARTELAGSLSLLTIQRWPARWSLTYHWVGETSQLSDNLLSPLDGLVDASAPDGHAWRGFGGGGSCGSGHTHANLDFAGVLADDVTELDLVWPGPNGHPQLTMHIRW